MNGRFISIKRLSRLQRSFTVIIEGGIGLFFTIPYPAESAYYSNYANSGGITDLTVRPESSFRLAAGFFVFWIPAETLP